MVVHPHTEAAKLKAWAFAKANGGNAICLQRNKRGNVQISFNPEFELDIKPVVEVIRLLESDLFYPGVDYAQAGTLPEIPEWFFFPPASTLFNGTLTAPNTPPTKLDLPTIVGIVSLELNQQLDKPT